MLEKHKEEPIQQYHVTINYIFKKGTVNGAIKGMQCHL